MPSGSRRFSEIVLGARTLLRAARRLSARMWAYQIKRALRNRLCRVAPTIYARWIDNVKLHRVPALHLQASPELASAVSKYYVDEYSSQMDDVARGRVTLFGRTAEFMGASSIEWHHTIPEESDLHLWRMKLAHMGFLAPMLVSPMPHHHRAVKDTIEGFRQRAHFGTPGCFSSYWFPYSASHRILAILSGLVLGTARGVVPRELAEDVADFLRWNAGFVLANLEHELNNNHVERNLAALCFYFEYSLPPSPRLCRRIDRWVGRIMRDTVLSDGTQVERSGMYQGLSVMALGIFAASTILSDKTRREAASLHSRAIRAWHVLSHPDGEIALFNDSWFGEVPRPRQLHSPAPLNQCDVLPDAGYVRFDIGPYFALFDAGAIGPTWNPSHGHSDFLSVELDVCGVRFIVDPGTFQYSTGPRRTFERSAQSHNGPCWLDVNPVEYWGCFKVGRQSAAALQQVHVEEGRARATGRLRLSEGVLRRDLAVSEQEVRVVDTWEGQEPESSVRLTIQGNWSLESWASSVATFRNGAVWARIDVADGEIEAVHSGGWACRYLESRPATVVVVVPRRSGGRVRRVEWSLTAAS